MYFRVPTLEIMKTNEVHESHNVAQKKPFEAGEKEGTLTNSLVESSSEGPDSGQLRQLQVAADASAQVHQLRTLQLAANHSPQVKQSAQLKEKATEFSRGALQNKENRSGLPAQLKAGIEGLSGMALDDVNVHYNSSAPAQLQAAAFAQGNDIHLGSGQEQHLAHEAWHVVQQRQGRVKPTTEAGGKPVNDDVGLEQEADAMGAKAAQMRVDLSSEEDSPLDHSGQSSSSAAQLKTAVVQCYKPGWSEVNGEFQVFDGQKWTVANLTKITKHGWVFTTREGKNLTIYDHEDERIRPTVGMRGPSTGSSYTPMIEEKEDRMEESSESNDEIESTPQQYGSMIKLYSDWNPNQQFQERSNEFGKFNVKHNRNAPYITTNLQQYPKTSLDTTYSSMFKALMKSGLSEKEVAEVLLDAKAEMLKNPTALRAAAMLMGAVYLGEQWRKHGAVKIFRALLRQVTRGAISLEDIPKLFKFVASAQKGREQVERIREILLGDHPLKSISKDDRLILGGMSPLREGDLDSEEELGTTKDNEFKKKRKLKRHQKEYKKVELNEDDYYQINGTLYNISHHLIRSNGPCFWDNLIRFYGLDESVVRRAATSANVTFNEYLDDQSIQAVVDALGLLGVDITIHLDMFTYAGKFIMSKTIGNKGRQLKMGLVVQPEDDGNADGHYIPGLN